MAAKKRNGAGSEDASSNRGKRRYPKERQPVKVKCKATNRFGKPCGLPPIRGGTVCHKHGGSTKQVKVKAAERLEDARQEMLIMLEPLLGRLRDMAIDPNTTDADVIRVFREVANRVGLSERHVVVPGKETPWDRLTDLDGPDSGITILRGRENIIDPSDDEPDALPSGEGWGADDDALNDFLEHRARVREQEATTRLDNRGHDIVPGEYQRASLDPFSTEERERREYERARSEHDPSRRGDPAQSYEDRLREGIEDR